MSTYKTNDNGVDREMTEKETADYVAFLEASKLEDAALAKAQADKAAARQVVLDRLGITADEAALLLG